VTQPAFENNTPFKMEPLLLADENLSPLLTVVVKATYDIISPTQLRLAEEQEPVSLEGAYWGDPETASLKYEPEVAFYKPATDVVLIGTAFGAGSRDTELMSGIKIGPMQKIVKVFGDRFWEKRIAGASMTPPQSIEAIPLRYEMAFGGADPRGDKDDRVCVDMRNPVGKGFQDLKSPINDWVPLPNLEDPNQLIHRFTDRPQPVGFGYQSGHWQARSQYAGTYDATWDEERSPLLPIDFDRRFFNGASPGLIANGFLSGDEQVVIANASTMGKLQFSLPSIPAPITTVTLKRSGDVTNTTNLDTVIINCDENKLFLLWRLCLPLTHGYGDIGHIRLDNNGVSMMA